MIAIFLIILISLIIGIGIAYIIEDGWHILMAIIAPAISGIIILLLSFFLRVLAPAYSDYIIKSKVIYITSLNDMSNTTGQFFLGCGVLNEKQIYSFYKINSNGLSSRDYIYSDDSEISQTGSKYNSYIIKLWGGWKSKNIFWFPDWIMEPNKHDGKYIIVVPPNTIKNELNLDNIN